MSKIYKGITFTATEDNYKIDGMTESTTVEEVFNVILKSMTQVGNNVIGGITDAKDKRAMKYALYNYLADSFNKVLACINPEAFTEFTEDELKAEEEQVAAEASAIYNPEFDKAWEAKKEDVKSRIDTTPVTEVYVDENGAVLTLANPSEVSTL